MTLIPIQGLSEQVLEDQTTAPSGGGFSPFPCNGAGWTRHTATVTKAELKIFDGGEAISLLVSNGQYGGEVLVNLPPYEPAFQEKAFETLLKTIKILGCHTNGQLDTDKLKTSSGQKIEIIARHKGFRQGKDGNWYHKVGLILTGEAKALEPVPQVTMPALPDAPPAVAAGGSDLPF